MRAVQALLLGAALTLSAADTALACSCGARPTAEQAISHAAVFTGIALKSVPAGPGLSVTTFRVTETFRGVRAGRFARIRHRSGSSASCGVNFSPRVSYTLSADRDGTGYLASLCTVWPFSPQADPNGELIRQMRLMLGR